jgi:hypothetical protein
VRLALAQGTCHSRPLAHRLVCIHCHPPLPSAAAAGPSEPHSALPTLGGDSEGTAASSAAAAGVQPSSSHHGSSSSGNTRASMAAALARAADHKQGLQRLVVALGGRVRDPYTCT